MIFSEHTTTIVTDSTNAFKFLYNSKLPEKFLFICFWNVTFRLSVTIVCFFLVAQFFFPLILAKLDLFVTYSAVALPCISFLW